MPPLERATREGPDERPLQGPAGFAVDALIVLVVAALVGGVVGLAQRWQAPIRTTIAIDLSPARAARLHAALALARVRGVPVVARLHARLRHDRRALETRREGDDPAPRHRAGNPGPRLPAGARPRHGRALPALERRSRARLHPDDLHRPGLEHDVLVLRLAALDSAELREVARIHRFTGSGSASGRSRCRRR